MYSFQRNRRKQTNTKNRARKDTGRMIIMIYEEAETNTANIYKFFWFDCQFSIETKNFNQTNYHLKTNQQYVRQKISIPCKYHRWIMGVFQGTPEKKTELL